MKTNQIVIRESGFVQRTMDGYFNANKLIEQWNIQNGQKKLLGNYMGIQATSEFIEQLKKEGIENPIITKRGRSESSGTWVHPKIFIDLAMWVSIEFKSKVIDYVLDGLIRSRHDAGDYVNEMNAVILDAYVKYKKTKPPFYVFINEMRMIRDICQLGDKERNEMTEKELNNLTLLQKVNSTLIKDGVGKDSRKRQLELIYKSVK